MPSIALAYANKTIQMNAKRTVFLSALSLTILPAAIYLAGCGSSGSSGNDSSLQSASSSPSESSNTSLPPIVLPDSSQPLLPMPTNIANGSMVELECGKTYGGTLDLRNKTNVTVKTIGNCGKAKMTPGSAIGGWSHEHGNIYSAPIDIEAVQVIIDGQTMPLAHWPNRPQTWAKSTGAAANSLSYSMPNGDVLGASLIFRPYEWAIEARKITAYSGNTMTLASTGKLAYDGYPPEGATDFYVEGKLWMLDSPGEWAISAGRLYLWTPDGQSPQGRVWAFPDRHAIEASDSRAILIDGVSIFGAANGINALGAADLHVLNTDIANSSENGIMNAGGSRLLVDGASIRNSRHNGISVKWGGNGEIIRNSRVDATGVTGMPANSQAAIYLPLSAGSNIANNVISSSGYIGIRAFRNTTISGNTVDGACEVMTDCGGIVVASPEKTPLNARIENNVIRNVSRPQRLVWAVYLGSYANGVTVADNIIAGNTNGMNIFDGFNNVITGNAFSDSTQAHIQMGEDGTSPSVRNNKILSNRFTAKKGEETYRISSDLGSASVAQFASYDNNTYVNSSPIFVNFNGEALSYAQWKARTGQDENSTYSTP